MELKQIMEESNRISTEKGFWEDYDNTIKKMKGLPKHFNEDDIERIKMAFYNEKISLISSELGEATEAMRIGKFFKADAEELEKLDNGLFQNAYITHAKDTFEDELADSFIRLCDLCYKMNIDIEKFISLKMKYNKLRTERHGKRF